MAINVLHESLDAKDQDKMLRQLSGIFKGLPPVPKDHLPPLLNPNQGQCVFCKKFTPLGGMPIINTGIVFAQEPLCPECRKRFPDQARIVCLECRQVILWVDPTKEKSGFEFKKKFSYHVKNCPTCKPGITCAKVLEKIIYYNEHNIPYE